MKNQRLCIQVSLVWVYPCLTLVLIAASQVFQFTPAMKILISFILDSITYKRPLVMIQTICLRLMKETLYKGF